MEEQQHDNAQVQHDMQTQQFAANEVNTINNAPVMVEVVDYNEPVIRETDSGKVIHPHNDVIVTKNNTAPHGDESYERGYQEGYAAGFDDGQKSCKGRNKAQPKADTTETAVVCVRQADYSKVKLFSFAFGGETIFCIAESMGQAIAFVGKTRGIENVDSIDRKEVINAMI